MGSLIHHVEMGKEAWWVRWFTEKVWKKMVEMKREYDTFDLAKKKNVFFFFFALCLGGEKT